MQGPFIKFLCPYMVSHVQKIKHCTLLTFYEWYLKEIKYVNTCLKHRIIDSLWPTRLELILRFLFYNLSKIVNNTKQYIFSA